MCATVPSSTPVILKPILVLLSEIGCKSDEEGRHASAELQEAPEISRDGGGSVLCLSEESSKKGVNASLSVTAGPSDRHLSSGTQTHF